MIRIFSILALSTASVVMAAPTDWQKSALQSSTPDAEVVRLTIGGGPKPNILERWWNGKRVRWIDESGTMKADDLRGPQVGNVMQVDINGDGRYDGPNDMNIKWADTNQDGIPDMQSVSINPTDWEKRSSGKTTWMIFINHDQRGVLGWIDWTKFDFDCWGHTGLTNWLPNYHGNSDFIKSHRPAFALTDLRLNWENPFSFFDEDGDGVSEWTSRWASTQDVKDGKVAIPPILNLAHLSFDLDNNSGAGNETSYDMTLSGAGGNVNISAMSHSLPGFEGDPKFDPLFTHNEWRRLKELIYMDRDKSYDTFFSTKWKTMYLVFDEDGDDHRWERVEMYYPTTNSRPDGPPVDIYSTAKFKNKENLTGGLSGHAQADSLGDRGEFDLDNSGGGKLYVGPFDRKLHLYGAEWGAWTVDKNAEFHGGDLTPSKKPQASKVEEVVKYTDTDGDGYIDTVEYDYDGDRTVDFKVCLLDYRKNGQDPQVAPILDTSKLRWAGLHEEFNKIAQQGWVEALSVYRAAWARDLTTPELDQLAAASSMMQRYQNGYWIKEKVFRLIHDRITEAKKAKPQDSAALDRLLADYVEAYYTGRFDEAVRLIGLVPTSKP